MNGSVKSKSTCSHWEGYDFLEGKKKPLYLGCMPYFLKGKRFKLACKTKSNLKQET